VIAQQALPHYQIIDNLLESSGVKIISFGSAGNPEIKRTHDTKGTFELPTLLDDTPVQLECEIFDFNKFGNTGKLLVGDGQVVTKGEYKFSVIGDQDVADYISAMLRKHVKVSCLRETSQDPFSVGRVVRLQLIKVWFMVP
ncbi:MAG: fructose 1,6-bisphosphatase, partial [Nitrospirales bacterium]